MKTAIIRQFTLIACIHLPLLSGAQKAIPIADQTFRMDGQQTFVYAFAEGDAVELTAAELSGKKIKNIEFIPFAGKTIFSRYETDSVARQIIRIPHTGIYQLRFNESGAGKKYVVLPCIEPLRARKLPVFPLQFPGIRMNFLFSGRYARTYRQARTQSWFP